MKDVEIPPRKNGIVGPFSYGAIIPQSIRKLNILETVEVYDGYGRIQWDLVWKSKHGTRRVYPKACNDVIEPVAGIVSLDRRSSIIREYRVAHLLANLGWVDFDLGSSPGWWTLL